MHSPAKKVQIWTQTTHKLQRYQKQLPSYSRTGFRTSHEIYPQNLLNQLMLSFSLLTLHCGMCFQLLLLGVPVLVSWKQLMVPRGSGGKKIQRIKKTRLLYQISLEILVLNIEKVIYRFLCPFSPHRLLACDSFWYLPCSWFYCLFLALPPVCSGPCVLASDYVLPFQVQNLSG